MRIGLRRGDHDPVAAAGVLDDRPAIGPRACAAASSSRNEPIGLVGWANAGSFGVDLDLRHDRDGLPVDARGGRTRARGLLELVADGALRVGAADVERHLVQLVRRELGSPQDEAHLRAVAVPDRQAPAVRDERRDVAARLLERRHLVGHGLCCLSMISALPPIATTMRGLVIPASPARGRPSSMSPRPAAAGRGSVRLSHREGHHGLLGVEPVLGLVVDDRVRAVDDGVRDLDVPVGGQRVHVDRVLGGQCRSAARR